MEFLTILLPAHNEEGNIGPLCRELVSVVGTLKHRWRVECVFIDDGSTDGSKTEMLAARTRHPELAIRVLSVEPNSGLSAALDAGFRAARGTVVATLDTDLQNDPADLPALLGRLEGADVVTGIRVRRQDSWTKRLSSAAANAIRNRVTRDDIVDTGCTLRVYRKEYLDRLKLFSGLHRFLPTLLKLEGARVAQLPVNHRPRVRGKSKYHLWNRLLGPLTDLLAVRWMKKRHLTYRCEEVP